MKKVILNKHALMKVLKDFWIMKEQMLLSIVYGRNFGSEEPPLLLACLYPSFKRTRY